MSTSNAPTFHQLVAIPLEQYSQMVNMTAVQQPHSPIKQKLLEAQQELNSSTISSPVANPYDRMMRQGMMLEEVKRTKEQLQNAISVGTPKPYRNRALALYNQIAPMTNFNEKGELLVSNDPIAGSRAEDLIQHAVRDRRKEFTPTGWTDFLTQLHEHNVPRMMLNRQTIDELQTLSKKTPITPQQPRATSRKRKLSSKRLPAAKRLSFLSNFEV